MTFKWEPESIGVSMIFPISQCLSEEEKKEGNPQCCEHDANRYLERIENDPTACVAQHNQCSSGEHTRWNQDDVSISDDQPHDVRHDETDEPENPMALTVLAARRAATAVRTRRFA